MSLGRILVVEDDSALREAIVDTLQLGDFEVLSVDNGLSALAVLGEEEISLVFSDIRMDGMDGYALLQRLRALKPHLPVVLMTAYGTIEQAVSAMKDGAVDYIVKPFEASLLLEKAQRYLNVDASSEDDFVAVDAQTQKIKRLAQKVAASDASVMITGESGTGKEVLARYLHQQSGRAQGPFIAINCAAIPETMLEATLFGYEKGAFTGAVKSMPGKFEQAQKGTLFLDEIGEMNIELQSKLLRVLQEREVERLGSDKPIALDVRVLSATNINFEQAIKTHKFREDLYYRLNVFPLHLAPLRERPLDIIPIAERLIARHYAGAQLLPSLTDEAKARLMEYAWQGNIRELDNVVQRAMVLQAGEWITAEDILLDARSLWQDVKESETLTDEVVEGSLSEPVVMQDLKEQEIKLILSTLKLQAGNRARTAEVLQMSPRTLRYKLAKLRDAGYDVD
ncbi:MAG: sigma-54-dependent Fis family transcriptional regulator [Thiotrichales bacterium 32-46-8]|nr:sigma-54 dependent transcriptional regulator [Gammaproteobacteria bacterium]OYX07680.1 MAG: sigma-54-dependent Fis family transcriptional regulator [Thiotrichales bacterium 32-46-8]OYY24308.1 MAG: sigma-54-dependent Fis family transcriptional regulator [Thiotrichales bacterium 35-46-9]OYZ07315.1 MAG: sigma-54-dependent Fis family transcriptional regulator [Thiotrichales bacterium 16-46-22]OYZ40774.1 MAG: sigma-54-dependent Fis family transcriptional regulator [Thiotrichales bacterium 24-47-4